MDMDHTPHKKKNTSPPVPAEDMEGKAHRIGEELKVNSLRQPEAEKATMSKALTIQTAPGKDFSVCGADGYILEIFETNADATAFLDDWASNTPTTMGQRLDMAAKHHALYRNL